MRQGFLAFGLLALAASGAGAQTIDTHEEAWQIANRNGVTIDRWDLADASASSAAFIQRSGVGGASQSRWVAMLDATDMSFAQGIMAANCARGQYRFLQVTTRDWKGAFISSSVDTEAQYPSPNSVGEILFRRICPPIIVPGPPITLPIEPTRQEDRIEYVPRT